MKKFDEWNRVKKIVEEKDRVKYSAGDVWMVHVGENVGVEEGGKGDDFMRPVVVIKKFNNSFCICVPLSTTRKTGIYYHQFEFQKKTSNALLSHVKSIDVKRFRYRLGRISAKHLEELKTKTRILLS